MNLTIKRHISTRLYTEGELKVKGVTITNTVEDTLNMLLAGTYYVHIEKDAKAGCRVLALVPTNPILKTDWKIGVATSWVESRKNHTIGIGDPFLIPGTLKNGIKTYERLFDRIEKAIKSKKHILLCIEDDQILCEDPDPWWIQQPNRTGVSIKPKR